MFHVSEFLAEESDREMILKPLCEEALATSSKPMFDSATMVLTEPDSSRLQHRFRLLCQIDSPHNPC